MANEITVAVSLQVANGLLADRRNLPRLQVDQTTAATSAGTQSIGTTHEVIALGGVTTAGYVYIRNIDETNFVEVGVDVAAAFVPSIKLLAGQVALFPAGATLYAKANTAAVKIDVLILAA